MNLVTSVLLLLTAAIRAANATNYTNPILPGFHPDPSCIYVEELDQTFFCTTSTFSIFPGIPIYASKNLTSWKLISNVLNRRSQLPAFATTPTGQDGIFAPTLRYHNGTFYLITTYVSITSYSDFTMDNIIFTTTDPYDSSTWSAPTHLNFTGYDPSLFWDTDGTAYFTGAAATPTGTAIALAPIDPSTGALLAPLTYPYNGTGIGTPEGPHLYHNPPHYYLLLAEGGSARLHRAALARSTNISGPYDASPLNPFVAAASNTSLWQEVGHADVFADGAGGWWGVALAARAGGRGAWESYPMGRETVLFAVGWEGGWPVVEGEVEGVMEGGLPGGGGRGDDVAGGAGPWVGEDDDVVGFGGGGLPGHWVHVRVPVEGAYVVEDGRLRLGLSARNLSAVGGGDLAEGTTFVARRQEHTLFRYSVDAEFEPRVVGEEVGVAVYLDEKRHVDLGIVLQDGGAPQLRLRAFSSNENVTVPEDVVAPMIGGGGPVRLEIRAENVTHFTFLAGAVSDAETGDAKMTIVGYADGSLVSGGYTGTLLGAYATTNGAVGNHTAKAAISRWRYQGQGQQVADGVFV